MRRWWCQGLNSCCSWWWGRICTRRRWWGRTCWNSWNGRRRTITNINCSSWRWWWRLGSCNWSSYIFCLLGSVLSSTSTILRTDLGNNQKASEERSARISTTSFTSWLVLGWYCLVWLSQWGRRARRWRTLPSLLSLSAR